MKIGDFLALFAPRGLKAGRRNDAQAAARAQRRAKRAERKAIKTAERERAQQDRQQAHSLKDEARARNSAQRQARAEAAAARKSRGEPRGLAFSLVSFPKSGRTWLRLMLDELNVLAKYTHDGSGHSKVDLEGLEPGSTTLRGKPIVFLYRDPRDTVVSGYFQATKRAHVYEGSISEFIRDPRHGIEKVARFNVDWLARGATQDKFYAVTYEDLKHDTGAALVRILEFVGAPRTAEAVDHAVREGSFDSMQERERTGAFGGRYANGLKPGDPSDPLSFKVREGIVGGYRKHLSEEDIVYCEAVLTRCGYPVGNHLTGGTESAPAPAERKTAAG